MSDAPDAFGSALATHYRIERKLGEGGMATVRLGSSPAVGLLFYNFSRDCRRGVKTESRMRGDAWMLRNFDGRTSP